ncbi:MAG: HAMP domain-containing sensor histidine kinase [Alkalispirochaeta sp.]
MGVQGTIIIGLIIVFACGMGTPTLPPLALLSIPLLMVETTVFPPTIYSGSIVPRLFYILTGLQGVFPVVACLLRCRLPVAFSATALLLGLETILLRRSWTSSPLLYGGIILATLLVALILLQLRIIAKDRTHIRQLYEQQRELNHRLSVAAAQLMEQKRRASLTVMADGLAHEINNPVNYMKGHLAYLREELERLFSGEPPYTTGSDEAYVRRELRDIMIQFDRGLSRISEVVQQLRRVSESRHTNTVPARLRPEIEAIVGFLGLSRSGGPSVEIAIPAATEIAMEPGDLFTLFSNLLGNAVDATEGAGEIRIEAEKDGNLVRVVVSDTGRGIAPDRLEHIFDPFFTEKLDQEHMGVGLALCRSVVDRHGGSISVESREAVGTWVTVELKAHRG